MHALVEIKEVECAIQAVENLNNRTTLINNTLNDDEKPFRSRMFLEFPNHSEISIPWISDGEMYLDYKI